MQNIRFFLICLAISFYLPLFAQTDKQIAGIYNLEGIMETAAGFRLKPDHTFEYMFTYGAADKWGKGTWKLNGTQLILTSSNKQPASDFILKSSDASRKGGVLIKITDAQGRPMQHIKCRLGGEAGENQRTDEKGEANFKTIQNGKLELYHPIYSVRISEIRLKSSHTNFLVQPAGDLSEVYFKDLAFQVAADQIISTTLPGMPPEDPAGQKKRYIFKKEK